MYGEIGVLNMGIGSLIDESRSTDHQDSPPNKLTSRFLSLRLKELRCLQSHFSPQESLLIV